MIVGTYIVPRGTVRCSGCSHDAHADRRCNAIAHFTRKRCECPGELAIAAPTAVVDPATA